MSPACGNVHYFRNLSNFETIRNASEYAKEIVILGGGFIGFELAACLNEAGKSVTMIFPEEFLGSLVFPLELSHYLHDYYISKGITIISGDVPEAVVESHGRRSITTRNGKILEADMVIASIGCVPNTDIALDAGLKVDNGIVVDEILSCGHPDIFAAGDVANFHSPVLNKRMRVEHADNAVMMGKHAGLSMVGHKDVYKHIPSFYADMFDQNLKAVGMIRSDMDIRAEWNVPFKEGVLYYSCENRINGVLYWNMPAKLDAARSLITEGC
jgi:NADPH-dependent 2,4-dienoyl-CoA reductase/sulfur reductase-like enzyme